MLKCLEIASEGRWMTQRTTVQVQSPIRMLQT